MCSVDDPQQVLLPGRPDQPVSGCSVGACGVRYVRSVAAAYEPEGRRGVTPTREAPGTPPRSTDVSSSTRDTRRGIRGQRLLIWAVPQRTF